MLIYTHIHFAICNFTDFDTCEFFENSVFYQSDVPVDPLTIQIEDDTIGFSELWDEQPSEYDEY